MRRELLQKPDLRSTQVSPSVASGLLNKATIRLFLLASSERVQASASLACPKVDGSFRPKTDFSAFPRYFGFGSKVEVDACYVSGLASIADFATLAAMVGWAENGH
jgi:hypothetical protein